MTSTAEPNVSNLKEEKVGGGGVEVVLTLAGMKSMMLTGCSAVNWRLFARTAESCRRSGEGRGSSSGIGQSESIPATESHTQFIHLFIYKCRTLTKCVYEYNPGGYNAPIAFFSPLFLIVLKVINFVLTKNTKWG